MYAKVFVQIFDSSIADDYKLRQFFTDLLVLSDPNGVVDMTPAAISARTRIPLVDVEDMISRLQEPDPTSRTPAESGARLRKLDHHRQWGWEIVNYVRYRDIASEEQRRERTKVRTRKWRNTKRKQSVQKTAIGDASVTHGDADVTPCNAGDAMQKQNEAETQKQSDKDKTTAVGLVEFAEKLKTQRIRNRWGVWMNHRRAFKKPKDWAVMFNEQIEWLGKFDEPTAFEILSASIRNGWQGLFEPKNYGNGTGTNRNSHRENPANRGITRGPTDYGEAAKGINERFERRKAEALARQVAANSASTPQVAAPGPDGV